MRGLGVFAGNKVFCWGRKRLQGAEPSGYLGSAKFLKPWRGAPMSVLQISTQLASSKTSALDRLTGFLEARRTTGKPAANFEAFEREVHEMVTAVETEAIGEELERFDLDVPEVVIDGVTHRRVLRCQQTYQTAAGPVPVIRSLYSTRQDGTRAVCPLELGVGIVEGFWTPRAAKHAAWAVAHLTPQESEEMFAVLGGMRPSHSILDRLPKQLSERCCSTRLRDAIAGG